MKSATDADASDSAEEADLAGWKSDIDELNEVPSGLNSLESKADNLDVDNLKPVPND